MYNNRAGFKELFVIFYGSSVLLMLYVLYLAAQANDSVIAPVFEPFNSSGAIA